MVEAYGHVRWSLVKKLSAFTFKEYLVILCSSSFICEDILFPMSCAAHKRLLQSLVSRSKVKVRFAGWLCTVLDWSLYILVG